jgi:hypothetical protein
MKTYFRTGAVTTEQVVSDKRCRVWGLRPDLTTTGTITLRNSATAAGSAAVSVSAIGLTQAGKDFDGMVFPAGLTIHLSVATDLSVLIYEPF